MRSVMLCYPAIEITYSIRYIHIYISRDAYSRGEMCSGHVRLCVSVSVCLSVAACPRHCTDQDVTWGSGRGCHLVVHCWAHLQSVHGFRCYNDIASNAKCQRVLVLALCLVIYLFTKCIVCIEKLAHRQFNLPPFSFAKMGMPETAVV